MSAEVLKAEPELIDPKALSQMLSTSVYWINKNASEIAGAIKVGGRWRFRLAVIRTHIALGKNILIERRKIPDSKALLAKASRNR